MILTCTSCATRYFADDASVGPEGRTVRCAACGHSWFVAPQLVLDQPAAEATFVEGPASQGGLTREQIERQRRAANPMLSMAARARAKQAERQKKERVRQALIAWGGAGGALAFSLGLALLMRQDVARIWPNTASAYAAIGLPVNITGLEFNQITVTKTQDGPTPMIVVAGAVRNISHHQMKPPVLRFSLRDDRGEELAHWMEDLGGAPLAPNASRPFQSSLDNPPPAASDLEATFATAREIAQEAAHPQAAPPPPPAQAPSASGLKPAISALRPAPNALKPATNSLRPAAALVAEPDIANPEGGPEEDIGGGHDGLAPRLTPEPASAPPRG